MNEIAQEYFDQGKQLIRPDQKLDLFYRIIGDIHMEKIMELPNIIEMTFIKCEFDCCKKIDTSTSKIRIVNVYDNIVSYDFIQLLCNLPLLEDLNMSYCEQNQLPIFPINTKIKKLNMCANRFRRIDNICDIFVLPELINLNISGCMLHYIREFDVQRSHVKILNISDNYFDQDSINLITKLSLKDLQINGQHVRKYYNRSIVQIISIDTLQKLQIHNNQFHNTSELINLFIHPQLLELDMSKCGIKKIKPFDTNISKLRVLNLERNKFDFRSAQLFCKLPHLINLNLSNCDLKTVPLFSSDSIIEKLNLSENKISNNTNLATIFCLPQLQELDISNCSIYKLATFDPQQCKVNSLKWKGNRFDQDSLDMIVQIPAISNENGLDLRYYKLQSVPKFAEDKNLTKLDLSNNDFECNPDLSILFAMPKLDELTINQIKKPNIIVIDYNRCHIKFLHVMSTWLDAESLSNIFGIESLKVLNLQTESFNCLEPFSTDLHVCVNNVLLIRSDFGYMEEMLPFIKLMNDHVLATQLCHMEKSFRDRRMFTKCMCTSFKSHVQQHKALVKNIVGGIRAASKQLEKCTDLIVRELEQ